MSDKPVREHDKFMLRLPDGMRDRLKEEAAKNKRSLNAEIIDRLELSFIHDKEMTGIEADLAEMRKSINELKVGFALMNAEKKP